MADNQNFKVVGVKTYPAVDASGSLIDVDEITFTWGEGFEGKVKVNHTTSTPDSIRDAIEKHIAKFAGLT